MREIARPVLFLHSDPLLRERLLRLRHSGPYRYQVEEVPDWSALRTALREAPPTALALVDPYVGTNGEKVLSPELHALLLAFPSATVLAALEVTAANIEHVRVMGGWGVSGVIALGYGDTPLAIAVRLWDSHGRRFRHTLQRALKQDTSARARALLDAAAEVVTAGGQPRDLARSLHLSRATLLRWSKRAGLPPPRQLLAWVRVLRAAELLDDPGRSVLDVGYACGYAADSGLRRITRKLLGMSPAELRARGAFAEASRAFLNAIGEEIPEA